MPGKYRVTVWFKGSVEVDIEGEEAELETLATGEAYDLLAHQLDSFEVENIGDVADLAIEDAEEATE